MSGQLSIQESRKRASENDDDIYYCLSAVSFIIIVVGVWYCQKYRLREVFWKESIRAQKRAFWMNDLKNDRICRDQLRLDIRCFDKLCNILQFEGG